MNGADQVQGGHGGPSEFRRAWVRVVGVLTAAVRLFGFFCVALLAVHVALTLGNANPENGITSFVASWADPLALGFQDLFAPADPKVAVLVNYGIAAIFWLAATALATRILRAVV